ncbi:unnamed protein product [Prunus armeniaca]
MSDKLSCFGVLAVRAHNFEDDNAKDGEKQEEMTSFSLLNRRVYSITTTKSKNAEKQDEMPSFEFDYHDGMED